LGGYKERMGKIEGGEERFQKTVLLPHSGAYIREMSI